MPDPHKLHAFARQLCMDRHAYWSAVYGDVSKDGRDRIGWRYTDEASRVFPRYNVDQAVLEAIERINPDHLPPLEDLRRLLVEATISGASTFTEPTTNPVHNAAMADEREWLKKRLEGVALAEVSNQSPLFYRRVLAVDEADELRRAVKVRWGAEGYWFPLGDRTHPSLVAYDLTKVDEPLLKERIEDLLSSENEARVFEIREWGPSYEIDPREVDFTYNGAEGFWTDSAGQWIVYASHENTITLGGTLAMAVQNIGPGQITDPV